jgi:hypothetical protein
MTAGRLALLLSASLSMLSQISLAADSIWIADSNGCKIWDADPQPNETVTWSGACRDGYADGNGVLQWIVDGKPGSRHEGAFVAGKATGKGVHTYPLGIKIEGEFVDGALLGRVAMTWPDGSRYEGDYVRGGGLTGRGVLTRANGERYEGDFVKGKWSGRGTFTGAQGSRYEGNWLDNKRSGQGSGVYADGTTYEGEWKDDKPVNPEKIKAKSYALNSSVTGSSIAVHNVGNLDVPPEKTYAQLTPAEKQRIKDRYQNMPANDEPPYPLHGLVTIMRATEELQHKLLAQGVLDLAVTVDAHGTATTVEVYKSPDAKMTKAMADVLMLEKYKPAVCNGSPCQMKFPFLMKYNVNL